MTESTRRIRLQLDEDSAQRLDNVAAALGSTRTELVAQALEAWLPTVSPEVVDVGEWPSLPRSYHGPSRRVFTALAQLGGGPIRTAELAAHLEIHRGNVDRHLTRLRSDGYVRRTPMGHLIVFEPADEALDDGAADVTASQVG